MSSHMRLHHLGQLYAAREALKGLGTTLENTAEVAARTAYHAISAELYGLPDAQRAAEGGALLDKVIATARTRGRARVTIAACELVPLATDPGLDARELRAAAIAEHSRALHEGLVAARALSDLLDTTEA